ncbi:MAG TPA: glycosyltransferase family 2 protein [Patescibacteria group bacterium]|nr:glycosyltransferase family 2 protein [Patescibacteria group bacterium]
MKKQNVYIIMLHHRDIAVTITCLKSLLRVETYPFHLILINNSLIPLGDPLFKNDKITVYNSSENVGFAKGVNIGVRKALTKKTDFILLLNNDTTITKPFLGKMIATALKQTSIGIVAPAIEFLKDKKRVYDIGGTYDKRFGRTSHTEVFSLHNLQLLETEYVSGCCMLIKQEVFKNIGLFDETFYLYYEDIDFCIRAKRAGFRTVVEPTVSIYHALSKTIGKSSPLGIYHLTRSAIFFGRKYFSAWNKKPFYMMFLLFQIALFGKHSRKNLIVSLQAVHDIMGNKIRGQISSE